MTDDQKRRGGRQLEFPARITLPLSTEMLADVDRVRAEDETRLEVIRAAIAREVKRRDRARS